jgi:hypothetical protein
MSTQLGTCPDCGQEYKDPKQMFPPPSEPVLKDPMPWTEYAAELHRDIECPVQQERDLAEGLERALRYFGVADTLRRVAELMSGENEHDSEILWGNPDRWLKRERERGEERPLNCPKCEAQLGVIRGGRFEFGSAYVELDALDGTEELSCRRCQIDLNLKEVLAAPEEGERSGGIGSPRPLRLVETKEGQEDV